LNRSAILVQSVGIRQNDRLPTPQTAKAVVPC